MTIGLGHYLSVAAILFTLGILGIFLNRKNVIVILMSIELILLAVNVNLVAFSTFLGDIVGQVYALIVLTVAAAEAAIGLAILVAYFRNRGSIAVEDINLIADATSPPPVGCGWGCGGSDREAVPPHPALSPLGRGRRTRRRLFLLC
jgi:NADH-quinone oxidoreductase subunit K